MKNAIDKQNDLNAKLISGMSKLQRGVCVSIDWPNGLATVNVAGATVALQMAGVPPIVGDPCVIGYFGTQPVVFAVPRAPFATTTAGVSGGLVAVTGDDGIKDVVAVNAFNPTTGTRIAVDWAGGGVMIGALSADPNTGRPVNGGGGNVPSSGRRTVTFSATDSGTQNIGVGNYWTRDVWCGDSTVGGYFYGSQIANTIPDGASIVSGFVHLVIADSDYGDPPTIGTHTLSSKSGNLSVSNAITIAAGSGNKPLNSTILSALKTGSAKGLATNHGGLHIYGSSPGSGAITITWQT